MAITRSKKDIKDILANQPKIRIMVPATPGIPAEQDYKTVTVNGYKYRIKCGDWVDVPETVANILKNSNDNIKKSAEAFSSYTKGAGKDLENMGI